MYRALGQITSRHWKPILAVWIVIAVALTFVRPPWASVVQDGEFSFLPEDSESRAGEDLFRSAFSRDFLGSNIVIIVRRESRDGLSKGDRDFIDQVLKPRIERIAIEEGGLAEKADNVPPPDEEEGEPQQEEAAATPADAAATPRGGKGAEPKRSVITAIRTFSDSAIGHLFDSDDGKASLVMINLRTELFADSNRPTIKRIEQLISRDAMPGKDRLAIPAGLDLTISGSATVGRDMRVAESKSADATTFWTIFLVIAILLIIYRAPALAIIPLVTVFIALHIAIVLISLMAKAEWIHPFGGIDVYITVVMYGAGVDYCVFLMSRYREELDAGLTMDEAMAAAIEKVGAAVVASAGTTMAGLCMMMFAKFGKFQQAGIAMSFSLVFVLAASITFTPALMMFFGRWAFWPFMRTERIPQRGGWFSPTSLVSRIMEHDLIVRFWERIGDLVLRRPGSIWLTSVLVMAPLAVIALVFQDVLSYGLMSELPADEPSVIGSKAVQGHFTPGITGPVTILVSNDAWNFKLQESEEAIRKLSEDLVSRREELHLSDVRSLSHPLGITAAAVRAEKKSDDELAEMPIGRRLAERRIRKKKIHDHYVADRGRLKDHITRIDVVFDDNPFSRDSIRRFEAFMAALPPMLPEGLTPRDGTRLAYIGPTSSIRDLKLVTGGDQIRINVLVIVSVFFVLVALVRHVAVAGYLIVSVYFSYLVALGMTFVVFKLLDWNGFPGLDWKVPIFLFVILIAVGEDYNIYLVARIEEESKRLGPIRGIISALSKTGGIISSCGVIMAGTFAALIAGTLAGMNQLGFALAFGVMLDTFVVRSILVPAYLVLLNSGRFGWIGRFLGASQPMRRERHAAAVGQDS